THPRTQCGPPGVRRRSAHVRRRRRVPPRVRVPRLAQRLRHRAGGDSPRSDRPPAGAGREPPAVCGHAPACGRRPGIGSRRRLSLGTGQLGALIACARRTPPGVRSRNGIESRRAPRRPAPRRPRPSRHRVPEPAAVNAMMLLEMACSVFGDRVAVSCEDRSLTYAELYAAAGRGAARLRRSGARHAAHLDVASPALPIALFASAWAGLPFVPLSYRLSDEAVDALLARIEPAALVTDAR